MARGLKARNTFHWRLEMQTKLVEIRDRGTFIPALAILVSEADGYLMKRAGFGRQCVYLVALATQKCAYDPFEWGNRTMNTAHQWIEDNWYTLVGDDVIDVEFILGETEKRKQSEQYTVNDAPASS
jgi:hypothetical protein